MVEGRKSGRDGERGGKDNALSRLNKYTITLLQ